MCSGRGRTDSPRRVLGVGQYRELVREALQDVYLVFICFTSFHKDSEGEVWSSLFSLSPIPISEL
jgi:hypothetical protein